MTWCRTHQAAGGVVQCFEGSGSNWNGQGWGPLRDMVFGQGVVANCSGGSGVGV